MFSRQVSPTNIWNANIVNAAIAAGIGIAMPWFVNMRRMLDWVNVHELTRKRQLLTEQYAKEKEFYFTQCQLMQESVEAVKSVRHDMKLHMFALKKHLADNKEAMTYLNSLVEDISESEIYSETGNMVIDSVINYKLKSANKNSIKPRIKTAIPKIFNIEAIDIVTILGNLLDNAIDAIATAEEKRIDINLSYNKDTFIIKVANTFDGIVKYTDDSCGVCDAIRADGADDTKKNIATRKGGDNHGYGLKNVRKAIDKYDGHMEISHDENIFSVGVMLYLGEIAH